MNFKIVAACILVAFAITSSEAAKLNNALFARYLCHSRPDGFQAIVPGSCSQYYVCVGGKTQLKTCPRFYDFKKEQCVNKNPGCVETISRLLDCKGPCCGIADGNYAVDPEKREVYYLCKTDLVEKENVCTEGQEFDLVKLQCAKPSECSDCTTKKPCVTTQAPCTTTTCTTTTCSTTTCATPTTPCTTPTTPCTTPTTPCTTPTTPCTTPTTPCTTPTTPCTTPTTPCTTPTTPCTTPTTPCTTPTTPCTTPTTPCTTPTTPCITTNPCITTPAPC